MIVSDIGVEGRAAHFRMTNTNKGTMIVAIINGLIPSIVDGVGVPPLFGHEGTAEHELDTGEVENWGEKNIRGFSRVMTRRTGRVRKFSKPHGSGRVGSRGFQTSRVGSDRVG